MMNTKNRKIGKLRAAKAGRQKKLALVLGALLAIILVVQVPRTLKTLHGSSSPTAAPASSHSQTPGSTTPGSTTPGSTSTPAATSGSTQLPESDLPPRRSKSQLFSFERFGSKDPFVQQVTDTAVSTPGAAPAATASSSTAGTAASGSAVPVTTQSQPSQSTAAAPVTAQSQSSQKTAAAVIEVNGQRQAIDVSQTFPQARPTFRLVSLQGRVATIGIAGGAFAGGNQTVALRLGKTLTLMNTTDGQRYELRLVSVR